MTTFSANDDDEAPSYETYPAELGHKVLFSTKQLVFGAWHIKKTNATYLTTVYSVFAAGRAGGG